MYYSYNYMYQNPYISMYNRNINTHKYSYKCIHIYNYSYKCNYVLSSKSPLRRVTNKKSLNTSSAF